jgi:hypothetical protein
MNGRRILHRTNQMRRKMVPGVGDWSPSDGKVSQVCFWAIEWWELSFLYMCMRTWFLLNMPFYRLSNDSLPVIWINYFVPWKGMVSLDGTWRCLTILACVAYPVALMTLRAYSHVGHYQAGHLAVLHLMSATTHWISIKYKDKPNLRIGYARHCANGPFWCKHIRASLFGK